MQSDWEDLCTEVLGKRLHHGPTQGVVVEGIENNEYK